MTTDLDHVFQRLAPLLAGAPELQFLSVALDSVESRASLEACSQMVRDAQAGAEGDTAEVLREVTRQLATSITAPPVQASPTVSRSTRVQTVMIPPIRIRATIG